MRVGVVVRDSSDRCGTPSRCPRRSARSRSCPVSTLEFLGSVSWTIGGGLSWLARRAAAVNSHMSAASALAVNARRSAQLAALFLLGAMLLQLAHELGQALRHLARRYRRLPSGWRASGSACSGAPAARRSRKTAARAALISPSSTADMTSNAFCEASTSIDATSLMSCWNSRAASVADAGAVHAELQRRGGLSPFAGEQPADCAGSGGRSPAGRGSSSRDRAAPMLALRLARAAVGRALLLGPVDRRDGGDGAERGERRQHRGEGVGREARLAVGRGSGLLRLRLLGLRRPARTPREPIPHDDPCTPLRADLMPIRPERRGKAHSCPNPYTCQSLHVYVQAPRPPGKQGDGRRVPIRLVDTARAARRRSPGRAAPRPSPSTRRFTGSRTGAPRSVQLMGTGFRSRSLRLHERPARARALVSRRSGQA